VNDRGGNGAGCFDVDEFIYLFIMISYTKYIEQTSKKIIKNKK